MSSTTDKHGSQGEYATYGGGVRQVALVVLLSAAMIWLYQISPAGGDLDPTALRALGFIVLASYLVGELAALARFPHITGYLIAGVLFGPSVAGMLPSAWQVAPFDRGVLNEEVIEQLHMLDSLAVALIAITAGGELKIDALRRGFRTILGVLTGQLLAVGLLMTAFVVLVSGWIPQLALPGLALSLPAAAAIGLVVAAISLATSPAATVAVINGSGAEGPMSRVVLSTVVLKDVVVVVAFSLASVVAAQALGQAGVEEGLGRFLLTHIGGSIVVGAVVGAGMALYLRYVRREILLFLVAVVFTATFAARALHLDPVLLFLTAGFCVANFTREGDPLIDSVERLSLPVYVVFFALAGAKLHLHHLVQVVPFALALVGTRAAALAFGVYAGARLSADAPQLKRYGWLGFISQAGVAISLTSVMGNSLGETGRVLETLLIAGIALNELVGPVLLKFGLSLAGELPTQRSSLTALDSESPTGARPPPAEPGPDETQPAPDPGEGPLAQWPEPEPKDVWSTPFHSRSRKLDERIQDLRTDLQGLLRDLGQGPLDDFRQSATSYLRELRREFLRYHRRLIVQVRGEEGSEPLAPLLRAEQYELAERWRGTVLARAVRLRQQAWSPDALVVSIDRIVESLSEHVTAPYEDRSFLDRDDQGFLQAWGRTWLRLRRGWRQLVGAPQLTRVVPLRAIARYQLSGTVPPKLEGVAALLVQANAHLAARTRSVFDGLVEGYDHLADELNRLERPSDRPSASKSEQGTDSGDTNGSKPVAPDPLASLMHLRQQVEEELALALEEVGRICRDADSRTSMILAQAFGAVCTDSLVGGTVDLPERSRRSSRLFRQRMRGIATLTEDLLQARKANAANYTLLALEFELVGLEARVKEVLQQHVSELERDVRGRAHVQVVRVAKALDEAWDAMQRTMREERDPAALAIELRETAQTFDRVASEAARGALQLRDQLADDATIAPLLDALNRATAALTDRYEVLAGRPQRGEWKLPSGVGTVEVPFRELVRTHLETAVAPRLLEATRGMVARVQPLAASLQELERLVDFNVELALGEVEVDPDEALSDKTRELLEEMVGGVLTRSREMLQGYVYQTETWPSELNEQLRAAVLGGVEELRAQLVDGDLSQARLEVMRRSAAGRRLMHQAEQLPGALARAREQARHTVRGLVGDERIDDLRRVLGLPHTATDVAVDPSSFAPPRPAERLPLVYRRLFSADTLQASDVLTGRDPDVSRAHGALRGDGATRLRTVALVGADGVGKASFSNAIVRSRAWKQVRRVELKEPADGAGVADIFQGKGEGQLVVVEGFHWLVSAAPGGFDPLRRFVEGVIHDSGRNAWLVHADQTVWRYAAALAALDDAFAERVDVRPLSSSELESAVLARHALSGFGLSFEPGVEGSRVQELLARGANRLQRPYQSYFRTLHRVSGGLVRDALRLWMASIDHIDEINEFVHVGEVPPSPVAALRRLPEATVLLLYPILRQGWMTPAVHASLFRLESRTAEAQLTRLAHLGLIVRHSPGVYRIAAHLHGPLVRVLTERGWL